MIILVNITINCSIKYYDSVRLFYLCNRPASLNKENIRLLYNFIYGETHNSLELQLWEMMTHDKHCTQLLQLNYCIEMLFRKTIDSVF